MLSDAIVGTIRTAVPTLVGTFVAWLFGLGVQVDSDGEKALSAALVALLVAAYYALATLLERKVNPAFGWLLGIAKAPAYSRQSPPAPAPRVGAGPDYGADL